MILVANIIEATVAFVAGVVCFCLLTWWLQRSRRVSHQRQRELELAQAQNEAESIKNAARTSIAAELDARRAECAEREDRLDEREKMLNTQLNRLLESENQLKAQREALERNAVGLENAQQELINLTRERRNELQKIANISEGEARDKFIKEIEQESLKDAANVSRHILDEAKARAEEKARTIVTTAIQRYASEHTLESTTATIMLDGDDIKGRIIGREGRNIRAFENATGVTVLIDDVPGAVILSAFDPIRREIAREAMQELIRDGRIHPTRIEEVVEKVSQDMEDAIVRHGEASVARAGLPPLHPEIVKLLGKLHFRQSFSQNLLDHSVEVAQLMGLMASELGVDASLARRAGLLHDIGKALSHEVEGPHAVVGADFIKRHGECEAVVNGVASHHNDIPPVGPLGILVSAADAISASRPGARSESMTTYLKRVESLERLGNSFEGVEKSFAVHAGRELRVFVQPGKINDDQAFALARSIAGRIEAELQYPGQIRITVIRETRCVEVAK